MGSNDIILIGAIVAPIIAYVGNIGGFKDWLDQNASAQPPPVGAPVFTTGKSGNCSWDTKGGWCWSSTSCGGPCKACLDNYKTTNIKGGCNAARNYFLKYSKNCPKCKAALPQGGASTCPYTGCSHIHADPAACYGCRCSNICRGTDRPYPNVDAKGGCVCKKSLQAYAYAGFDNVTVS